MSLGFVVNVDSSYCTKWLPQSVNVRPALTPKPSITYSGITTGAARTVAAQHRKAMFSDSRDISLDSLIAFDMFPKAYHVETIVISAVDRIT